MNSTATPHASGPAVAVLSVEKTYRHGTQALLPMDLTVNAGEFVILLGPSGCGKSTPLKMTAGLLEASDGRMLLWRKPVSQRDSTGRKLAVVFQEATLMPWARVNANVRLPLDLAGVPRAEADARVAEALASVGLEKFDNSLPRELSGGMQRRVSIARALVVQPDVLLMDEPFGALGEITRNKLDCDLSALWARKNLTVVFVMHSIYEAVFLSSRVVVMAAMTHLAIKRDAVSSADANENTNAVAAPVAVAVAVAVALALVSTASAGTSWLVRTGVQRVVYPTLLAVVVLALWRAAVTWSEVPASLVPSLLMTAQAMVADVPMLLGAAAVILKITWLAFTAAVVLCTLVAFAFVQSRLIETALFPRAVCPRGAAASHADCCDRIAAHDLDQKPDCLIGGVRHHRGAVFGFGRGFVRRHGDVVGLGLEGLA